MNPLSRQIDQFLRMDGAFAQKSAMKVENHGDTMVIVGLKELGAANAQSFRDKAQAAFSHQLRDVEVDLSQTMFLDSCGLGALISIHKAATGRGGVVRLLRPTPPVRQILELTRMDRIFEIVDKTAA